MGNLCCSYIGLFLVFHILPCFGDNALRDKRIYSPGTLKGLEPSLPRARTPSPKEGSCFHFTSHLRGAQNFPNDIPTPNHITAQHLISKPIIHKVPGTEMLIPGLFWSLGLSVFGCSLAGGRGDRQHPRDFPGVLGVKIPCLQCRGQGFSPSWGN